jgi:hypothetical protein
MRRVLWIESRRGAAVLLLLCLAAEAFLLYQGVWQWSARWMGYAVVFRDTLLVVLPLAAAGAAWHASRDHRHGLTELITSAPRPRWQKVTLGWSAVTLAALTGVAVPLLVVAVLVAARATYAGGGWWALIVTGVLSIGAAAAAGVLAGRLWPYRIVPPLLGVGVVVVLQGAWVVDSLGTIQAVGSFEWLTPALLPAPPEHRIGTGTHLQQMTWFAGLTAGFLILAGARCRLLALAPLAVAAAVGAALMEPWAPGRWVVDTRAQELTCRTDGDVRVCLIQPHTFALDQVTTLVGPAASRLARATGARLTFSDLDDTPAGWVRISVSDLDWQGRIRAPAFLDWLASELLPNCDPVYESAPGHEHWVHFGEAAAAWALGGSTVEGFHVSSAAEEETVDSQALLNRLRSRPENVQRAWIAQYMAARSRCDDATAQKLLRP